MVRPHAVRRRYTKELLEEAARKSISVAGVLRALGLRQAGGTQSLIARRLREYGVDTSHFLGATANSGEQHRGGPGKNPWQKVLVLRTEGRREYAYRLRRALIESGVDYCCKNCGLKGEWNGKALMLQINHKNRDWLDDRRDNLEFLCPNCHSQTPGWCGSKGLSDVTSVARQSRQRTRQKRCSGEDSNLHALSGSRL